MYKVSRRNVKRPKRWKKRKTCKECNHSIRCQDIFCNWKSVKQRTEMELSERLISVKFGRNLRTAAIEKIPASLSAQPERMRDCRFGILERAVQREAAQSLSNLLLDRSMTLRWTNCDRIGVKLIMSTDVIWHERSDKEHSERRWESSNKWRDLWITLPGIVCETELFERSQRETR